jgi:hypothetical protein
VGTSVYGVKGEGEKRENLKDGDAINQMGA